MTSLGLVRLAGAACALALLGGCGGPGGPELYPVTGTVLYDGQPVEGAVVSFRGEQALKLATGTTDSQGRFRLTTSKKGDGAVAGRHHVIVSKFVVEGSADSGPVSMDQAAENPQPARPPRNELPEKYADPARPLLEFTVSPEGPNDFTIRLSD
jgi:hypothetical protein